MARRKVSKTKTSTAKNKTAKNTQIEPLDQEIDNHKDSGRSSSKKPSVMETLKRKSSDTYLNAAKVPTNIINNNSSSNNNILSSTSSSLVHTRGPVEMTASVNNNKNQPQQSQQQEQQTSSVSFYNDHKYLHKKFKRIASATSDVNNYTNHNNNNNNNNNDNNNQQVSLANNLIINRTKSPSSEVGGTLPVKQTENSLLSKVSNNNFSSANISSSSSSSHHPIINNDNLINNFKVVQNHTKTLNHIHSQQQQQQQKHVPQVMTAYENYIITKEKLTHHQVQQIDAAKNSSESFVNNNNSSNNNSSKIFKKYENPPNQESSYTPSTSLAIYQSKVQHDSSLSSVNFNQQQQVNDSQSTPGRYVCPFCQLVCTKPSVLEKHIRAHTNERPYPCSLCGFAFKTKSNLHKHFKSRAHMSRERGEEPHPDDDMASYGSDGETTDKDTSNSGLDMIRRISPVDERTSSPSSQQSIDKPYKPKFHLKNDAGGSKPANVKNLNVVTESFIPTLSTATITTSTTSVIQSKTLNSSGNNFVLSASAAESVKQHIQKLISQNSAIIDVVDPALQKKYHKITGINRSVSVDNTINSSSANNNVTHHRKSSLSIPPRELQAHHVPATIAPNNIVIISPKTPNVQNCQIQYQSHTQLIHPLQATPQAVQIIQQPIMFSSNVPASPQQTPHHFQSGGPLNLATKPTSEILVDNTPRSRKTSQELASAEVPVVDHPKNPERSIIKDLLLNSRTFGVVAEGELNETPFMCHTCKKVFQNADLLKYHTLLHCDGGNFEQQQHHLYEEESPQSAPISPVASPHQYIRSNSIHVSSLPDKSGRIHGNPAKINKPRLSRQKPDNIIIGTQNVSPVIEGAAVEQFHLVPYKNLVELTQAPLPSPGPLLGKTPLIDMYSMQRLVQEGSQVIERKLSLSEVEEYQYHQQSKRPRFNSSSLEFGRGPRIEKLQMFGGDIQILEKNSMVQYNSGGTMSSLSPNSDEAMEDAPLMIRTGLNSGGIAVQMEKEKTEKLPMTPKLVPTITPTLTITQTTQSIYQQKQNSSHFQFPPLNPITCYNPLTLPPVVSSSTPGGQVQSIMHGGKLIPFVPGIPGPNTFNPKVENMSKKIMASPKTPVMPSSRMTITVPVNSMISPRNLSVPSIKLEPFDETSNSRAPPAKQSFNFSRIADNISPSKKSEQEESKAASVVKLHQDDVRIFNYENLIAKNEIIVGSATTVIKQPSIVAAPDDKAKVKEEVSRPSKFLRPSSLPLKPGTFTPKQHHGITPTANTLPLISPETPRPSKTCVQQYHNGHAYTYLGLKCSTKPFYCTVNKPQPAYCVTQAKLSMYSNWQVYQESKPHPLQLKPLDVMLCYRSYFKFERNRKYTIANTSKTAYTLVNSSESRMNSFETPTQFNRNVGVPAAHHSSEMDETTNNGRNSAGNAEEEYVRGRGRGKYVCETCGIKCKKPSMLKKHIRTHTDERPHTCTNCNFSFKTKGNLTKHMKSKAHYKKCIELGIPVEEYQGSEGDNASGGPDRQSTMSTGFEDESENESDCDDDTESDDNEDNRSRLPEHEAARCLLSLSMTPPATNLTSNQQQQPSPQPIIRHVMKEKINEPRLDEISCRRIITFAAPKTEFDLQGQYYSDPNLIKVSQSPGNDDCPIDLTKRSKEDATTVSFQQKKQVKPKVSDVVSSISGTASLLASLVSITDKFPGQVHQNGESPHFVTDHSTILPHKYITDRALLDTKIKQNQIKLMVNMGSSNNNLVILKNPVTVPAPVVQDQAGISMMDTLAEVAASSVKLDVTPIHSPKVTNVDENVKPVKVETEIRHNSNAKNIASEFLKLTQNAKNHERSSENEAEGESGSDQDGLIDKFVTRTVVVGPGAFNAVSVSKKTNKTSDAKPAFMQDEGKPLCPICKKVFPKQSALKLHLNIHAMERKYKCDPCGQGFRTQGHLQKHNRSAQHQTKVSMTSTFGVPSQSNPRPFKCKDCSTQFRIHGHLAKHLRSKLHVMRLECLQKLPFGTYAEIERSGISLTNIDTSDCDTSLASLRELARSIHEKDPTKLVPVDQLVPNQSMDDMDDETAGTGIDSDGEYGDSDDGNDLNTQEKTPSEPLNGLKRPYLSIFETEMKIPLKVPNLSPRKGHEINSDSEKSLQDPLKLDTPPPRPASAIPAIHHDTHTS